MQHRRDVDRYLEDVALIKQTLKEQEDRILLAPWTFYAWAAIIGAATVLSAAIAPERGWSALDVAVRIWIPAVVTGGALETIGWVQYFRRDNRVVLTGGNARLFFSFIGVAVAAFVIVFLLLSWRVPVTPVILLLLAIFFFLLAVFSFKHLFVEAYVLLIAGIVLALLKPAPDDVVTNLVVGIVAAFVFLGGGLHSRRFDRRGRER